MISLKMNWRIKLEDEKPPTYMGKKGLEMLMKDFEDSKISTILKREDIEKTYTEWSAKVLGLAEKKTITQEKYQMKVL